jgi:pyruvate dehydrogenase complex dehydrogenase (E1) component
MRLSYFLTGTGGEPIITSMPESVAVPAAGSIADRERIRVLFGQPATALGVCSFGQSGSRSDLYRCMEIDTESTVSAAFDAVDRSAARSPREAGA